MKKKIKEMTFKEMLAWTENFSIFYMEDFVNAIKYSSISDKESLWQELKECLKDDILNFEIVL